VPFIVMELLDGEPLAPRLARARRLSPPDTARIMTQVGRAMTKAHDAGIVHRDLKPDNIFLVRNDEEEVAKVLDFGIAKSNAQGLASVSSATRTGSVLGTPYYMSPEQAEGAKSVDHRTDIWAMGVIACECLVGSRPFDAETLGSLLLAICAREMPVPSRLASVPAGFDAWFARACSRDVGQRFATAKQAAQELSRVCAGESMSASAGPPRAGPRVVAQAASLPMSTTIGHVSVSSANELPKKSAAPWVALGVLALGAAAGAAFFVMRASDPSNAAASAAHIAEAPPTEAPKTPATPALGTEPPKPDNVATPAATTPVATASASAPVAATPPVSHPRAHAGAKPRAAAAAEKPAPVAAPVPAPATTAPAAKPRVNLGI